MGLFFKRSNPDVYKNNKPLVEPNQNYLRHDHLTELINEQQSANSYLKRSFEELKTYIQLREGYQAEQLDLIGSRLGEITDWNLQHKEVEELFLKWLQEQKQAALKQENFQEDVIKRLDNQEALTEKIVRELFHLRSILFERTNYLVTKIEDGYKITSSYVYKLLSGSEQPLAFFLMNEKASSEESKNKNRP